MPESGDASIGRMVIVSSVAGLTLVMGPGRDAKRRGLYRAHGLWQNTTVAAPLAKGRRVRGTS